MSFRVFSSAEEYAANNGKPCVATLGTFDGFHRGHESIFSRVAAMGKKMGLPQTVITFHPHPRVLVTPDDPPLLLTTPEEKVELLKDRFDGSLVFLEFNDALRQMTADEFARAVLIGRFKIKGLVVGYNHSFGHHRSGNIDKLAEIAAREGFELEVVGPVRYKDMPISSSRIRRVIAGGEWEDAVRMLGHPYPIRGTVVKGLGEGKKMGWPTINIEWSERKLLPAQGVYSCTASVDESRYRGMMFVGVNMLNPKQAVSVEANLFEFDHTVYNKEVTLFPTHFIRQNQRFSSQTELARQIARDKDKVLELLN